MNSFTNYGDDYFLSVFTIALLKDTGFWNEVNENLAEPIHWGKSNGCVFVDLACYDVISYNEFEVTS
jgi:proprotein convertase subtilisin/kexin type 5